MMKKSNKKGFTMVELIIVIALIAILASVLIPTFANLINKANDSAYQQERTNQMIKDEIEKIDQGKVYMSWEDLEEAIAEALKDQSTDKNLADKIIAIIGDLGKTSTGLTDEQLAKILDAIANKKFSDTQVKVILEDVQSGNTGLTEQQIADILAKLPQTGITEDDLKAAITAALGEQSSTINAAVQAILDKLPAPLTEDQIKEIVDAILEQFKPAGPVGTGISTFAQLQAAFQDGGDYYLVEDITVTAGLTANTSVTIDFNNHNITIPEGAGKNSDDCMLSVIGANNKLTFNGTGTLAYAVPGGHTDAVIGGFSGASVVINGGTYLSLTDYLSGGVFGNLVINGGTFLGSLGTFSNTTITINVPCVLKVTNDMLPFTMLGNTVIVPDTLQYAITGTNSPEATITVTEK